MSGSFELRGRELSIALGVIHKVIKENYRGDLESIIDIEDYIDEDVSDEEICEEIATELYQKYSGDIEKAIEAARRLGRVTS